MTVPRLLALAGLAVLAGGAALGVRAEDRASTIEAELLASAGDSAPSVEQRRRILVLQSAAANRMRDMALLLAGGGLALLVWAVLLSQVSREVAHFEDATPALPKPASPPGGAA